MFSGLTWDTTRFDQRLMVCDHCGCAVPNHMTEKHDSVCPGKKP